MKEIKITASKIEEALGQIDTIAELNPKNRACLRLLTEEMFSMCRELLGTYTLDFGIKQEDKQYGKQYALTVYTETRVDETAREQLLSVSSSGKNAANRGVKGMLGAVLEIFSTVEDPNLLHAGAWAGGMQSAGEMRVWTLSKYMEAVSETQGLNEWDGLEKSIVANFADDVSIGVRSGMLEMTVLKSFYFWGKK